MTSMRIAGVMSVCLASATWASPHLLEPADFSVLLGDYHPASPVRPLAPAPVRTSARWSSFTLGLALVGAGLLLGGAGFAVLYACREGTSCHNDTTTTVGWVLAAPGVLPLGFGLLLLYGSSSSRRVEAPVKPVPLWAWGLVPVPGGAMLGAVTRF